MNYIYIYIIIIINTTRKVDTACELTVGACSLSRSCSATVASGPASRSTALAASSSCCWSCVSFSTCCTSTCGTSSCRTSSCCVGCDICSTTGARLVEFLLEFGQTCSTSVKQLLACFSPVEPCFGTQ